MMELYDHVKIKSSGVTGIIDDSGYPGRWPLYTCTSSEIEPIN